VLIFTLLRQTNANAGLPPQLYEITIAPLRLTTGNPEKTVTVRMP
jgi:hypothetical protein